MPWDSLGEQTGDLMQVKDSFVVHAESNAIDNTSMDLNGATMYVTLSPCPECAKRIANRGISKVVCLEEYSKKNLNVITRKIFEYANVEYVVYQNLEELYAGMEEIKSYLESIKQKSVRKIEIKQKGCVYMTVKEYAESVSLSVAEILKKCETLGIDVKKSDDI